MSNTIKIKRGSGTPTTSNLAQYELAYDHAANKLYIHDPTNSSGQEIVEITGSTVTTAAVSNGATTLATGDQIYDHVTSRISGLQASDAVLDDLAAINIGSLGMNDTGKPIVFDGSSAGFILSSTVPIGMSGTTTDGLLTRHSASTATVESNLTFDGSTLATAGVVRNTNNANVDGPNFNVSTTNKTTAEYAYRVDRSGSVVGGILIDGKGAFSAVGIGVTDPSTKLEVAGHTRISGVGNALYFDTTGTEASNYIRTINDYETLIANGRGSAGFGVIGNQSIRFGFGNNFTNAETDLFINTSGNVGIGSTNPARKLEVAGGIELSADDNTIDTNNFTLRRGSSGVGHLDSPGNIRLNIDANNNQTNAFFEICANASTTPVFKVGETGIVTTGTWNGTAIASAYIADNAINAAKLNVSGNGTNGQVLKSDGDGTFSWFSLVSNSNASTLDNLDSTQFLRSDATDTSTGKITFNAGMQDNATHIGVVGSHSLDGGTLSTTDWANFPVGYRAMIHTNNGTTYGSPVNNYGYFLKVANRDTAGGWGGIWVGYATGENYLGRTSTSGSYASWEKIWTSSNDGSGSGLDADLLDGSHASAFATLSGTQTFSGAKTFTGRLTISDAGADGLHLNQDTGATSNSNRLFFTGSATSAIFQSGSALSFRSGATAGSSSGTQQMYINSSGMTMFNNINMNANAISGVSGIYGNGGTFIGYNNLYQFKNTSSGILATISGSTLDIPNAGDWSFIKNNTNSGGLRFGTKDGSGNYANQIEISNTGNYVKLNENTTVTGQLTATTTIHSNQGFTTDYGIRFNNGATDFMFYNNTNDNLFYLRDLTNAQMLQTWTTSSTTIHKPLYVTGNLQAGSTSNPVLTILNTATAAGSGPTLSFGHNQGGGARAGAIKTHLTDGSTSNRTALLRFHHTQQNVDVLKLQLGDNYVRQYQKGDTSDYLETIVNDDYVTFHVASGNYVKIQTDSGYLNIGPQNSSWNHFITDRPGNYFNSKVIVDSGIIGSYDEDLSLRRANGTADRIDITADYSRIIVNDTERFRATTTGATITGHAYATSSFLGPNGSDATPAYRFNNDGDTGMLMPSTGVLAFSTAGNRRYQIDGSGNHGIYGNTSFSSPMSVEYGAIFNEGGHDSDTRIEGSSDANLFRVDAGNDKIGIGIGNPGELLHVDGSIEFAGRKYNRGSVSVAGAGSGNGQAITLSQELGTTLSVNYQYKITLSTTGTGTDTGAVYILSYNQDGGAWSLHLVSRNGSSSNHPLAIVDGNNLKAYHNHSGTYNILYFVELWDMAADDATLHNWGSDYQWTRDVNTLTYSAGDVNIGGKLGIGTTSPSTDLHINTTDDGSVTFSRDGGHKYSIEHDTSQLYLYNRTLNKNQIMFSHSGPVTINNDGHSTIDFRVEGDTNPYLLFTDASTDRVGIGTGSPTNTLHVEGSTRLNGDTIVGPNNNNSKAFIRANNGYSTQDNPDYTFYYDDKTGISHPAGSVIGFNTGQVERLRITNQGITFSQNGSAAAPSMSWTSDPDLGFYRNGANNMRFSAGNAIRGTWNGDGLVLNGGSLGVNVAIPTTDGVIRAGNDVIAFYSSDERLKENVKPIENALDKVSSIRGVEFDWIVDKEIHANKGHDVGVIAQEIEKVLPEVVETRDNGYKAVKYEKIVSLLIEAVKEQQVQIDELKTKLGE